MTGAPATAETVTIAGTVYLVGRDVSAYDDGDTPRATSRAICTLTARRPGSTETLIVRDQIAHGAFVAMGSARLQRTPSGVLRAALEPLLGPFPTITPAGGPR